MNVIWSTLHLYSITLCSHRDCACVELHTFLHLFVSSPVWPGARSPVVWRPQSPPSTPTQRRSSSSGTSASSSSRASARSRPSWTLRPSTTSATVPSSPSPVRWTSTLATEEEEVEAVEEGSFIAAPQAPWTWVRTVTPWARSSAEGRRPGAS